MLNRRDVLKTAGAGAVAAGGAGLLARVSWPDPSLAAQPAPVAALVPQGTKDEAVLEALPGKAPLIKLTYRPPNYEMPVRYLDQLFTPNDAFFVRYHLAGIPEIDAQSWRLEIGGDAAASPFELRLDQLKSDFPATEIAAVCMCSGNRRGLFQPHVPGVQWGYGAIGNAKWKGARLRDVLAKAGVKKAAVEVVFEAADGPVLEQTPDFAKSIPIAKALDENALIAYEMNGQPLPHYNGFPARIVVPGWTATYWVKHITGIKAVTKPFDGFWVAKSYRIPNGKFPVVQRFLTQETEANTPITEMLVNSQFTNVSDGQQAPAGKPIEVKGIAWDGGYGIQGVSVSADGGKTWADATLGEDAGRFSFRQFGFGFTPAAGQHALIAKATNKIGQTQVAEPIPNPAGYHHNVMQRVTITAS